MTSELDTFSGVAFAGFIILGHRACFLSGSAYQIEWVPLTLLAFVVTFLVGYKRRSVIGEKIEVVSD